MGSGKFGTPWERMQREKASGWAVGDWEVVDPDAAGEPPHAAASRARPAVAMIAAVPVDVVHHASPSVAAVPVLALKTAAVFS